MGGQDIAYILASGRSYRFGPHNKLLALINGQPIIQHVVTSVKEAGYQHIVAIIQNDPPMRHAIGRDIHILENKYPDLGQSHSLSLAARHALNIKAQSVLIMLGDMPFVTPAHIRNLKVSLDGNDVAISSDGQIQTPPILFTPAVLPEFKRLTGDQGAKRLLGGLKVAEIITGKDELKDIDYTRDLPR